MSEPTTREDALATLRGLIRDMTFTMFTTQNASGELSSRPMTTQQQDEEEELRLSFVTSSDQPIVADVHAHPRVMLTYSDPGRNTFVVVKGEATVTRDPIRAEQYWNPLFQVWFEGPYDPRLVIVDVEPHFAEYWDSPSKPRLALDFVKQMMTGKVSDHGAHETLEM